MADSSSGAGKFEEKLANFQGIAGLDDPELFTDFVTLPVIGTSRRQSPPPLSSPAEIPAGLISAGENCSAASVVSGRWSQSERDLVEAHVVSGGMGLISGALDLGARIPGGVISRTTVLLWLAPPSTPNGGASSSIPPGSIPNLRSLWDLKPDKKRELFQDHIMVHQHFLRWHSQEV